MGNAQSRYNDRVFELFDRIPHHIANLEFVMVAGYI